MTRFNRPAFNPADLAACPTAEARNRLLFDWWCDEEDRDKFIKSLNQQPTAIPSRAPLQNDPAPPADQPTPQGMREIFLLTHPRDIHQALSDSKAFSNIPYAGLGAGGFMLALDPGPGPGHPPGTDWHAEQRKLTQALFAGYSPTGLRELAGLAVRQAGHAGLARASFDAAALAEQAALRYLGTLFGYGFADHPLLEDASRAGYRALQYLAVGQHFVSEPGTVPAAQQAIARLCTRSAELMDEYARTARSPRLYGPSVQRSLPTGVQAWSELRYPRGNAGSLDMSLRKPALALLPGMAGLLGGRELALLASTLIAGTVGNLQTAFCLLMQRLLEGPASTRTALRNERDDAKLEAAVLKLIAEQPPTPVLPRRTGAHGAKLTQSGKTIPPHTDCLLLLEGQRPCPHTWGEGGYSTGTPALHACLGQGLSLPLLAALVREVLNLPDLRVELDVLTLEALRPERLWGFACTRYPLRYERARRARAQNLIVVMRIKSPVSENATRLRRLIAAGAPRIEQALAEFRHVHFAWFEISDDESQLVLRTLYDGDFDAYIRHFALKVGDLFDRLFDYLEGAPPLPVNEHPDEFVEAIRRYNRAPLVGYLFSAYPRVKAATISTLPGALLP